METNEITTGQTYQAGERRGSPWWRILSTTATHAHAVRTRRDGTGTWTWDENGGRDFSLDIIREHWTLIG